eukprot:CAMPEP_0197648584 /NCGR_PEP_ID=MMETSP1338-20131121/27846_1 /TAXON_ID=43686 ORGANISM="Pelagodinium beii, Strain RCC1491" /NCGR_SAMPLE_ID=MMETSP1338 /ASSEMBLY_ACC=CAM_ASM_000754 /LENGTH=406 /DNA_ID=CAMNT_0043222617 /DNA_START=89 /DNA_END=1306 /DNA_ORIENTATION=-
MEAAPQRYEVVQMVMMTMEQYQNMLQSQALPEARPLQAGNADTQVWMAPLQPGVCNESWVCNETWSNPEETAVKEKSPESLENSTHPRAKLSTSSARRMRRKRANERVALALEDGTSRAGLPMAVGPISSSGLETSDCEALKKLLSGSSKDVEEALLCLQGRVQAFSFDAAGCRVIQKALEVASPQAAAELAKELSGHVLESAVSPHANYVLQKVISQLHGISSSFIAEEIRGAGSKMARHRYACRIMCRLLEFCSSRDVTKTLIDEILMEADELCCHNFGHHVIQSVLEHGEEQHRRRVLTALSKDPLFFAKHRNASYLMEKALPLCSHEDLEFLLPQLACPEVIADLALHQFGCFVARALMEHPSTDRGAALPWIAHVAQQLEQTRYGQRFLVEVGLASESQYW